MDFELSEEQRLLVDSVRRFLEKDYAFIARKAIVASPEGHSPPAWSALAELGLLAMPLPEAHGGFASPALDLMPVMEAMGEALAVEPYVSTLMGARAIERGGPDDLRAEVLPKVAEGALKLAVACLEEGGRFDPAHVATTATPDGEGFVLEGAKTAVLHAPMADRLLVSARTPGGISLFVVDAKSQGVAMHAWRALDGHVGADVRLQGVRVPAEALVGKLGEGLEILDDALDYGAALSCAEAVGAMASASDATLDYLKTRKQFGVAIGSFQALQHRMVDLVIEVEQARSMASLACAAVGGGKSPAERRRIVSMAKVRVGDACRKVSQESVQLHGGMGMTEELKVSHTFRRLTTLARLFGDVDHHLARLAAE